jgi:lethal(2) giant larvae protein
LKHKAPVLSIAVLNGQNQSVESTSDNHKVLICSEEQFKVFTLPQLKPSCKYKLTATEGTRVRKISINQFTNKTGDLV